MKHYPKLSPNGSITRPIHEPDVRVWVVYNDIGQPLAVRSLTHAQASALREQMPNCTVEPINPDHQQ